jgi:hypothetical protein
MLPVIERSQSMDGVLAWFVGVPLAGFAACKIPFGCR